MTSLENVQRGTTKIIPGLKNLSYEERLQEQQLPPLVYRRLRGDMIEAYKLTTGQYQTGITGVLQLDEGAGPATTGHKYKLMKRRCYTRLRQNAIVEKIVNTWNNLPSTIVEVPSVLAFEKRLDKH